MEVLVRVYASKSTILALLCIQAYLRTQDAPGVTKKLSLLYAAWLAFRCICLVENHANESAEPHIHGSIVRTAIARQS